MEDSPLGDTGLTVLKWLVIGLTATMLLAMVTLIWLFVTRLPEPMPALPDFIDLPDGASPAAFTRARGFIAVVTDGGEILIYSPDGATLRQRIEVE